MSNFKTPLLETYLAQIARELRDLPAQARADELREIEAHLRAIIAARGDEAEALAQFGKPRKIGRELRRAWERKQPEAWWRLASAVIVGISFTHVTWLAFAFVATGGKNYSLSALNNYTPQIVGLNGSQVLGWTLANFFVAGLAMGAISPKHRRRMGWIFCLSYFIEMTFAMRPNNFSFIFGSVSPIIFYGLMAAIIVIISLPCFYGVQLGARFSRKFEARLAK